MFIKRHYLEETEKPSCSVGGDILIMHLTIDTFIIYKKLQTNKTQNNFKISKTTVILKGDIKMAIKYKFSTLLIKENAVKIATRYHYTHTRIKKD